MRWVVESVASHRCRKFDSYGRRDTSNHACNDSRKRARYGRARSNSARRDNANWWSEVPAVVETAAATTLSAADFEGLASCVLLPEKTLGPFPLDQQFDRRDVTEGYEGHPVRLGLRVVDQSCAPVPGAKVEIWHADATGDYSAFIDGGGGKDEAAGTTFLRGTQTANDEGIVEFLTVFPGWYHGRTPHIHLRVRVADTAVLASQMFFDETYANRSTPRVSTPSLGCPTRPMPATILPGMPSRKAPFWS